MAVSGVALGAAGAGALFIYAGVKGYSIPMALQNMIQGAPPGFGQAPPSLTGAGTPGNVAQQSSSSSVATPNANLQRLLAPARKTSSGGSVSFPYVGPPPPWLPGYGPPPPPIGVLP